MKRHCARSSCARAARQALSGVRTAAAWSEAKPPRPAERSRSAALLSRLKAGTLAMTLLSPLLARAALCAPPAEGLLLAWQDGGAAAEIVRFTNGTSALERRPLSSAERTPTGSLWKLFVYFYITENGLSPQPYGCRGQSPEEIFCCKPGQSVGLDEALAKSCGLYFAPERIGIDKPSWTRFWRDKMGVPYAWLTGLEELRRDRDIPVAELLDALSGIRSKGKSFPKLNAALARIPIDGTARGDVRLMGSLYRVKTFTADNRPPETGLVGGFAGWLSQGPAVWAYGKGTSTRIVSQWSRRLAAFAQGFEPRKSRRSVEVEFFSRYPLAGVLELPAGTPARPGPLTGSFRVRFKNGNSLDLAAAGNIRLSAQPAALRGYFDMDEYVARVIDREFQAYPLEAAKAMAVVVRTYLLQNARKRGEVLVTEDSTHAQRVSVNPPSAEALRIARWSDQLVLSGVAGIRYHLWRSGPDVLSWGRARDLAAAGYYFDQILRDAYPEGRLGVMGEGDACACRRLPDAELWIREHSKKWLPVIEDLPGFEAPKAVQVCESDQATPYSDIPAGRIFMRFSEEQEDQVTAAHEYLHLAFQHHPSGEDEKSLEGLARRLVSEEGSENYGYH